MVDDDLIRIIAQALADAREKGLDDACHAWARHDGERCLRGGQYVAAGVGWPSEGAQGLTGARLRLAAKKLRLKP